MIETFPWDRTELATIIGSPIQSSAFVAHDGIAFWLDHDNDLYVLAPESYRRCHVIGGT